MLISNPYPENYPYSFIENFMSSNPIIMFDKSFSIIRKRIKSAINVKFFFDNNIHLRSENRVFKKQLVLSKLLVKKLSLRDALTNKIFWLNNLKTNSLKYFRARKFIVNGRLPFDNLFRNKVNPINISMTFRPESTDSGLWWSNPKINMYPSSFYDGIRYKRHIQLTRLPKEEKFKQKIKYRGRKKLKYKFFAASRGNIFGSKQDRRLQSSLRYYKTQLQKLRKVGGVDEKKKKKSNGKRRLRTFYDFPFDEPQEWSEGLIEDAIEAIVNYDEADLGINFEAAGTFDGNPEGEYARSQLEELLTNMITAVETAFSQNDKVKNIDKKKKEYFFTNIRDFEKSKISNKLSKLEKLKQKTKKPKPSRFPGGKTDDGKSKFFKYFPVWPYEKKNRGKTVHALGRTGTRMRFHRPKPFIIRKLGSPEKLRRTWRRWSNRSLYDIIRQKFYIKFRHGLGEYRSYKRRLVNYFTARVYNPNESMFKEFPHYKRRFMIQDWTKSFNSFRHLKFTRLTDTDNLMNDLVSNLEYKLNFLLDLSNEVSNEENPSSQADFKNEKDEFIKLFRTNIRNLGRLNTIKLGGLRPEIRSHRMLNETEDLPCDQPFPLSNEYIWKERILRPYFILNRNFVKRLANTTEYLDKFSKKRNKLMFFQWRTMNRRHYDFTRKSHEWWPNVIGSKWPFARFIPEVGVPSELGNWKRLGLMSRYKRFYLNYPGLRFRLRNDFERNNSNLARLRRLFVYQFIKPSSYLNGEDIIEVRRNTVSLKELFKLLISGFFRTADDEKIDNVVVQSQKTEINNDFNEIPMEEGEEFLDDISLEEEVNNPAFEFLGRFKHNKIFDSEIKSDSDNKKRSLFH